jgi:hypothetical protein
MVNEVVAEDVAPLAGVTAEVVRSDVVGLETDVVDLVQFDDMVVAVESNGP